MGLLNFFMYYVYILYSKSKDRFYKGQTSNLKGRVDRHNSGKVTSTRNAGPWILLWSSHKESRSEAMILEKKLKNLNRGRLIEFMLKYQQEIVGRDEMQLLLDLSRC